MWEKFLFWKVSTDHLAFIPLKGFFFSFYTLRVVERKKYRVGFFWQGRNPPPPLEKIPGSAPDMWTSNIVYQQFRCLPILIQKRLPTNGRYIQNFITESDIKRRAPYRRKGCCSLSVIMVLTQVPFVTKKPNSSMLFNIAICNKTKHAWLRHLYRVRKKTSILTWCPFVLWRSCFPDFSANDIKNIQFLTNNSRF
jgi:hypothetical protein